MKAFEARLPLDSDYLDISNPVSKLRRKIGIPDKFSHRGINYRVFDPRVVVIRSIQDMGLAVNAVTEQTFLTSAI